MKKKPFIILWSLLLSLSLGLGILNSSPIFNPPTVYAAETSDGLLPFKGEKQIQLQDWDNKGRAQAAHIQLKEGDQPTKKRAGIVF